MLPGPEAQQLAIYIGWLLHRTWGGLVAGALFVIPSIFILWTLSFVYAAYGNVPWVAAIFYGLKPAVIAIVAAAVIRIGRKALKNEVMWSRRRAPFIAIFSSTHFPHHLWRVIALGRIFGHRNLMSGEYAIGERSCLATTRIAVAHQTVVGAASTVAIVA